MQDFILLISSPDSKGLIYKISQVLFHHKLNIEHNSEFVDPQTQMFFMRTHIKGEVFPQKLLKELSEYLPRSSYIQLKPKTQKNIVIMATKESHVLGDLFIRHMQSEIDINIQAVIANHADLKSLTQKFDIPFYHIDAANLEREDHEKKIKDIIYSLDPDFIVLAKYMRVLTPRFVNAFTNRILNIHHSFLPAFIGANPYKQAYERGVKIIGATAHIVTEDLDQGPIICQDTAPVDHTQTWQDMRTIGRDIEKTTLAAALKLLIEDRVIVHQGKTIIL